MWYPLLSCLTVVPAIRNTVQGEDLPRNQGRELEGRKVSRGGHMEPVAAARRCILQEAQAGEVLRGEVCGIRVLQAADLALEDTQELAGAGQQEHLLQGPAHVQRRVVPVHALDLVHPLVVRLAP
eukprot:EG_transcript_26296